MEKIRLKVMVPKTTLKIKKRFYYKITYVRFCNELLDFGSYRPYGNSGPLGKKCANARSYGPVVVVTVVNTLVDERKTKLASPKRTYSWTFLFVATDREPYLLIVSEKANDVPAENTRTSAKCMTRPIFLRDPGLLTVVLLASVRLCV